MRTRHTYTSLPKREGNKERDGEGRMGTVVLLPWKPLSGHFPSFVMISHLFSEEESEVTPSVSTCNTHYAEQGFTANPWKYQPCDVKKQQQQSQFSQDAFLECLWCIVNRFCSHSLQHQRTEVNHWQYHWAPDGILKLNYWAACAVSPLKWWPAPCCRFASV